MSAATITSYGGNGQKDVCFMPWKPMQFLSRAMGCWNGSARHSVVK